MLEACLTVRPQRKRVRAGEVILYFSVILLSLRKMSHISCMLCGLQRSTKNYDPSNYDNEIYLITKNSRGYAGGFEDEMEPILGDAVYTPIVKDRVLEIVRAFIEKGIISENELSGLIPKTDVTESFIDKAISSMLHNALTGASADSKIYNLESEKRELSELVNKMKTDYNKLGDDHRKLTQNYVDASISHIKEIISKDLLDYALMHFLKYCDAQIGGSYITDFKVFLMSLDTNSRTLLGCLYQDLTVEEWCSLMDKIQGKLEVQLLLDTLTTMKKTEVNREYNKLHLFNHLWMFRILKLSSWN